MTSGWRPAVLDRELRTRVVFDDTRIAFRFEWDQPHGGGWLHDALVYQDDEWRRFAAPAPWATDDADYGGFYEDRVSFFLDDGSVRGFTEFGGWLAVHAEMRTMPDQAAADEVRAHDHYGDAGLGRVDIRHYLPQACAGEWWENDWRAVRPPDELAALKRQGVFLDLPMWRAHRSDPLGYGTDHHVLDYRHTDAGRDSYTTQDWDPEGGPELMFDPAVVAGGALDHEAALDGTYPPQGTGTYALTPEVTVPYDPAVAEREGAMIPRRPLREPHGSAADWSASGRWGDATWTVEMRRALRTDHPGDTTQLRPGGVYDWAPAVHAGAGQRWHWVGYPHRLGLGTDPTYPATRYADRATITATRVPDARSVDWNAVPEHTQTLVFPGVTAWSDLVTDHSRAAAVRELDVTIWELHDVDP